MSIQEKLSTNEKILELRQLADMFFALAEQAPHYAEYSRLWDCGVDRERRALALARDMFISENL